MGMSCSFCLQDADPNFLSVSSKVPTARICDKCLFRELEKLFSEEANLTVALDRLAKEHRATVASVTAAVEARVQVLNTSAVALDAELSGLREMKRQLQDALRTEGGKGGAETHTGSSSSSSKADLRASAVKRLVDERMNPGTVRAPESGVAATGN